MSDYTKTTWTDGVTKLGPTNLNHLETGVDDAHTEIADHETRLGTIEADALLSSDTPASNEVPVWNGSAWVYQKAAYASLNLSNGDIPVAKLTAGSAGQVVTTSGGVAVWATPATVGYGTSLPGTPADGDEYVLVDSTTTPTYQWRFRYNSGSNNTDKWEFVGGAPAYSAAQDSGTGETTSSTTYTTLTTAGPSFAIPRAGVYVVAIGFTQTTGGDECYMSYDIGGTGAVDADAVIVGDNIGAILSAGSRTKQKTLTAVTLTAKYRAASSTLGFANRWMSVIPVRVS